MSDFENGGRPEIEQGDAAIAASTPLRRPWGQATGTDGPARSMAYQSRSEAHTKLKERNPWTVTWAVAPRH
jgi:hypothetical protein